MPAKFIGEKLLVKSNFADDEKNTETQSVVVLHLGGRDSLSNLSGIHGVHLGHIEYVTTDPTRTTITWVQRRNGDGSTTDYAASSLKGAAPQGERRVMDCIDCHNTVGHPISPTPEQAVDRAIAIAMVSHDLPFARRESVRLVKATYPTPEAAARAIDEGLRSFYGARSDVDPQALSRTVGAVQDLYRRNVFSAMNVTWGSYPDNKGHVTANGCFRCHDDSHEAKDGSKISADCEYCHRQIERP
jgi:cytochrome c2